MAISNKPSKAKIEKAPPTPVAPAKPLKADPPGKPGKPYEPTKDEIQARAFEIYISEGCKPGSDLENWVRAEKELRARGSR
jgi:hypothetical protein